MPNELEAKPHTSFGQSCIVRTVVSIGIYATSLPGLERCLT